MTTFNSKSQTGDRTLQHICKAHKTPTQSQPCKRAAIADTRQPVYGATVNKPYKNIYRKFAVVKRNKSIQLKAAFLLTVFSLNIVVGFACSVGLDMGFNSHHHHDEETATTSVTEHHHEKAGNNHSHKNSRDNCCNDKVLKISQTEKTIPQTAKILSPVFLTSFVATYYNINLLYPAEATLIKKYFELGNEPPGSEIRIFIQSFQI